jgi:hypothetical protein
MPEPTFENQLKLKLFEWELINRDEINKGKFFDYTENDLIIINDFNTLDLNSNNITIAFGYDDKEILEGISIWTYDNWVGWAHPAMSYTNHLTFNDTRYVITIEDFRRSNSLIQF